MLLSMATVTATVSTDHQWLTLVLPGCTQHGRPWLLLCIVCHAVHKVTKDKGLYFRVSSFSFSYIQQLQFGSSGTRTVP